MSPWWQWLRSWWSRPVEPSGAPSAWTFPGDKMPLDNNNGEKIMPINSLDEGYFVRKDGDGLETAHVEKPCGRGVCIGLAAETIEGAGRRVGGPWTLANRTRLGELLGQSCDPNGYLTACNNGLMLVTRRMLALAEPLSVGAEDWQRLRQLGSHNDLQALVATFNAQQAFENGLYYYTSAGQTRSRPQGNYVPPATPSLVAPPQTSPLALI